MFLRSSLLHLHHTHYSATPAAHLPICTGFDAPLLTDSGPDCLLRDGGQPFPDLPLQPVSQGYLPAFGYLTIVLLYLLLTLLIGLTYLAW